MIQELLPRKITGSVSRETFDSPILGVKKNYQIYLPPGYYRSPQKHFPVLYLFRGHEKEWFDPYQDHSRGGVAIQHLADELINAGEIGEMIIVGPGMMSDDGEVYGLGVNFLNPAQAKQHSGIGSGRFEDYFVTDVIGHIEREYRAIPKQQARGADGFSLGGYTAVMLALKHPGLFSSVGSYDGSHMFLHLNDPRYSLNSYHDLDTLWVRNDKMFAPAFCNPGRKKYNIEHLRRYSSLDILEGLTAAQKKRIRQKIKFYIKTAAFDGFQGNRDRGVHLVTLFQLFGIPNHASALVLSSDAHHTWKFADLHMRETLIRHAETMGAEKLTIHEKKGESFLTNIEIISTRHSDPFRHTVQVKYRIYEEGPVKINILNLTGEQVVTLQQAHHPCGHHQIVWQGQNGQGHWVPSGVYFAEFVTLGGTIRKKFVFLR